jgi:hypothetical protein
MARQAKHDNYPCDVFSRRFRLHEALGCSPSGAINQSIGEFTMAKMTAAQFIADTYASYGVTQLFFAPVILSQTLAEIERCTSI